MAARLADMHCHLELFEDMLDIATKCDEQRIRVLAVTASPRSWRGFHDRIRNCESVRVGLGLHPQLGDGVTDDLPLFEKLLPECKYVGEIGLDGGRDFAATLPAQRRAFRRVLSLCSEHKDKVLSIHSVRSAAEVLALLESDFDFSSGKVILHWFTGTAEQAKRAAELGCFFSVNHQMLRSESGRKLVEALPLNRLLTESDGPFVLEHGRPATPLDIGSVVRDLARLRSVERERFVEMLEENLRLLLT